MDSTRRGLGRGLGALIPGATSDEPSGPITEVDVSRLSPNPFQPRRDIQGPEFDELVASVRRHGVLQPVIVRPSQDGYEVVAGERRWRAAEAAGISRVPAIIKEISDREMLELALIENLRRQDLNPIDRALAYRRLSEEFHMTQEQVAEVVGGSRPAVANTMRLLDLPGEVQASISQGRISEGHGRALLTLHAYPNVILELWRSIEEKGLSVRETEDLAKSRLRRVSRETVARHARPQDPQITDLAMQLRERYATSVSIVPNGKKGTIQIHYYSPDDLERLIDMLMR
jgi:ParB family chromosome partitioning protein